MSAPRHRGIERALNLSRSWLGDAVILTLATTGTVVALDLDRPRTAVLVYLLGVMFVGAMSGLYRGLLAALIASFIYNFFLSEPVFRLGVSSFDELVPLLAFNVSAIVSGGLAGRLNDQARAARLAESKNALLLQLSDRLQRALSPPEVEAIARVSLAEHGVENLTISFRDEGRQPAAQKHANLDPAIEALPSASSPIGSGPSQQVYNLTGSRGELGAVSFTLREHDTAQAKAPDLQAVANLLALAIDRCLLSEQLSESLAAQKSEELKNALLSSVSHDLRTPLTAIEAAATSLRTFRHTLSPEQEDEMLTTISEQCAKLNRYTANLLDMGRIQAGISSKQLDSVDLIEILGVALSSMRKRFPDQELCKEVSITSVIVHANAAMLEQAIFNLLENAAVHGGAGKPILVRLTVNEVACFLEITDSGPGISATEQSRVFERFYRGRDLIHREGSGLGLHIAKGFVEAFAGTIEIQSPVVGNTGTTVTVCLPIVQSRDGEIGDAYPDS